MHCLQDVPCNVNNLHIWDPLEFFHRNSIEYCIHSLTIKDCCFFLSSCPLTNSSGWSFPTIFNGEPYSLINRFQIGFHHNLLISIVISIKVWRNHKRVTVFHDSKGQGLTLGQETYKQELSFSDTTCLFCLDPLNHIF